ncbi:adhesin [Alkalihalobacterium alkalinitrilicum]|uniref:adhesin n=1 Tax=Alkalihalobacterium alkalinitrilicum TaxID=427920 RepID=UPI000995B86E|nr:adhesin [Alkalihalobacterium alkalinitrilicum]
MKITDKAKELLQNVLNQNGAEGIRLYAVAGCCGPQFAISLDTPQESDHVKTINNIKVAMDPAITASEELTIDVEEPQEGAGLVLLGASSCC